MATWTGWQSPRRERCPLVPAPRIIQRSTPRAGSQLSAGVDKKEALTKIYPVEVLNTIVGSSGNFERWGIPQGQGELAAAVAQQFVVPQALAKMLNSGASAADAANEAQKGAEQVKKDLGG